MMRQFLESQERVMANYLGGGVSLLRRAPLRGLGLQPCHARRRPWRRR